MKPNSESKRETQKAVSTHGRAASDVWHIGLPSDIQRKTLAWAAPVLRSLAIHRGGYIQNGISAQIAEVMVKISRVRSGYSIYLWRGGLTAGGHVFGRSQAAHASKWISARITSAKNEAE